jgi:hypothetical protein
LCGFFFDQERQPRAAQAEKGKKTSEARQREVIDALKQWRTDQQLSHHTFRDDFIDTLARNVSCVGVFEFLSVAGR